MPKFIPQHTPYLLSAFTAGYMEAIEWLLPENVNRTSLRGFSKDAINKAKLDCDSFETSFSSELGDYLRLSGRDMGSAGHDFYLSRNGHGAGFFDRGFDKLQEMARAYGEVNHEVYRNLIVQV